MHVCLLCAFIFPAIESNEECTKEGEGFEYQEEKNQGQATQGKPPKLDTYLNPNYTYCMSLTALLKCMFLDCYTPCSNLLLA
jgi:hypothetical protein